MSEFSHLGFNLSSLSIEIIEAKMKAANIEDFDEYLKKVVSEEMKKRNFNSMQKNSCVITRKKFNKPFRKKQLEFIQDLSSQYGTTMSNVLNCLLLQGPSSKV